MFIQFYMESNVEKSLFLIVSILFLVACNNSNPTKVDSNSSSSQKQADQSSSSNKSISSSNISSSTSIIRSSSSSTLSSPTKTILSKQEVFRKFDLNENDISIAEKWFAKWDSLVQLNSDSISETFPYNEAIDSIITEIYDINLISWCEILGDSFRFVQTSTELDYGDSTYGILYNLQGEQVLSKDLIKTGTSLTTGAPYFNDYITCTRQNTWINIRPVCNDDVFEIIVNWNDYNDPSHSTNPEKFISSILNSDTFYASPLSYYYNESRSEMCIL